MRHTSCLSFFRDLNTNFTQHARHHGLSLQESGNELGLVSMTLRWSRSSVKLHSLRIQVKCVSINSFYSKTLRPAPRLSCLVMVIQLIVCKVIQCILVFCSFISIPLCS
ncbi:hypothetical protein CSKR_202879 [Clonorchis sinensis]|uniref:Uncharacterized protein n=1 Tax=Clonorchis sinensis TaxID=79923 RepID=A0A8T1M375_CLOSI|nr:hypothetical protein CSKR_202879 [Clonorchis sinensis]